VNVSQKRVSTLLLLVFCLQGTAWSLALSKGTVLETQIKGRPDTVFIRNNAKHAVQVQSISLKLANPGYPNWEISLRSNRAPAELCFGKGFGVCPPAGPEGSFKTGWTVPVGDSLILSDFNLAECIRCPLAGSGAHRSADTISAALVFRAGDLQDTLVVRALLGRAR
jgi:hypothetical protein